MFVDPKRVAFETKEDIIDYVSGGILPPRESHFNKVMEKLKNPQDSTDPTLKCKRGKEVIIDDTVVPEKDREVLANAMARVYGNRVEKRDTVLTVAGAGIVATLLYALFGKGDKD